jgi:hypothetical protein
VITQRKEPPADADAWKDVSEKLPRSSADRQLAAVAADGSARYAAGRPPRHSRRDTRRVGKDPGRAVDAELAGRARTARRPGFSQCPDVEFLALLRARSARPCGRCCNHTEFRLRPRVAARARHAGTSGSARGCQAG